MISTSQRSLRARSPSTAACNSIRLLVVCGSDPYISRFVSPKRRMQAQPPGPGLPKQDPSVMTWTFFMSRSGGNCLELSLEKSIHPIQNVSGLGGPINFHPQLRSVAHAVREVRRELLHLTHHVGHGAIAQHAVVSTHDLIALVFGRMIVRSSFHVLPDLAENPGIRRSGPANHYSVATSFINHSHGVFRRQNIAIADHRDAADGGLQLGNTPPIRLPVIALLACPWM